MSLGPLIKINRKLIMAIFAIEFILCSAEGIRAINCHRVGGECWSWFFVFIANIPASIAIDSVQRFIHDIFSIESFAADTILTYTLFLTIGTFWWSLVIHLVVSIYKYTSRFIADR
jgi:hypothetical protein